MSLQRSLELLVRPDVVMVCPYDLTVPGGVQNQALAMARELNRRGRHVTLVSPGNGVSNELLEQGIIHVAAGTVHVLAANGSRAPVTLSYRAMRRLFQSIAFSDHTVLHVHEPITPITSWPVLASHPCATLATFHRSGVDNAYRLAGRVLGRRLRNIDLGVAVSSAAQVTAREAVGVDCEVLFNGVDVRQFQASSFFEKQANSVLFLGRDEPRKGRSVLLEASSYLGKEVRLSLTGNAPANFSSTGADVVFLGTLSEVEKTVQLARSMVLCAPSLGGESFGIVLIEGLAAGCSVVASDIDGYRQALGGHGTLVRPGNAGELADAITRVLQMGRPNARAGLAYARAWSMETLVDHYEDIYERAKSKFQRLTKA